MPISKNQSRFNYNIRAPDQPDVRKFIRIKKFTGGQLVIPRYLDLTRLRFAPMDPIYPIEMASIGYTWLNYGTRMNKVLKTEWMNNTKPISVSNSPITLREVRRGDLSSQYSYLDHSVSDDKMKQTLKDIDDFLTNDEKCKRHESILNNTKVNTKPKNFASMLNNTKVNTKPKNWTKHNKQTKFNKFTNLPRTNYKKNKFAKRN